MSRLPFKNNRCCWVHERLCVIMDPPHALCDWAEKARAVVQSVYPTVDWDCQTEQSAEFYRGFIFCLEEHFLVPDSYMDLEGVRLAWRAYYESCIPL